MMNRRAAELGLKDSHFRNPHGLDASGHYSSALDMSRLMQEARKHSEFRRIVSLRSVYLPRYKSRPARRIRSTNRLWGVVKGMRGGKTGFTNHARYCFVGSASRDGVMLTTVVLGSPSSADRFTSSRRLLEWGFKHYRVKQLCANTQGAGVLLISGTASQTVGVRYASTVKQPVLDVLGAVARVPSLPSSATVPVFAGQKLGVVRFVQAGTVLATVDAVASAPKASAEETVGTVPVEGYPGLVVVARRSAQCGFGRVIRHLETGRPQRRPVPERGCAGCRRSGAGPHHVHSGWPSAGHRSGHRR